MMATLLLSPLLALVFVLPPSSVPHSVRGLAPQRCSPVRLGVPGFLSWVESSVPSAATRLPDNYTSTVVAFDMNALLHNQFRKAKNTDHVIMLVFSRLHATLRLVRPGSTVLLALDGPAPVAKISTQRARRHRTSRREAAGREGSAKGGRGAVSSLHATPGTSFMRKLEEALIFFACSELSTMRARHLSFLVSGSEVPGEGEIKILGALHMIEKREAERLRRQRERQARGAGGGASGGGASGGGVGGGTRRRSAVLVGADGDLVLQALTLDTWDVSVLRSLPSRGQAAQVISLGKLRDGLGLGTAAVARSVQDGRSLDLIGLACLNGNDYLPKAREASFERVWRAYKTLRAMPQFATVSLIEEDLGTDDSRAARLRFNRELLAALLLMCHRAYSAATAAKIKLLEAEDPPDLSEARALTALVGLEEDELIASANDVLAQLGLAERSADASAELPRGKLSPRYDALEYLRGVLWTVQMYRDGACPDYTWSYAPAVAPPIGAILSLLLKPREPQQESDAGGKESGAGAAVATPVSRTLALPASVIASLILPREDAAQLAPASLSRQMQVGGALDFSDHAPSDDNAESEAEEEKEVDEEAMEDGGDAANANERRAAFPFPRGGDLTRGYDLLLDAAAALPADDEYFERCRQRAQTPAWLEMRRVRQPKNTGGPERRRGPPSDVPLPPPELPPRPPTDRMRPVRGAVRGELRGRWVSQSD